MLATIWGCRGTLATPGPQTLRYGGNTSCVELRLEDGTLVVLDAGTGIRALGAELGREETTVLHLLLTHFHFDHIEGLGSFSPLQEPAATVHVWGPSSPLQGLKERIARYLSPPLFPLHLSEFPCELVFHDLPSEAWQIGSAVFVADPVSHPGPTVGYRVSENGRSLAYIPDHEPVVGIELGSLSADWLSGSTLCAGVDVLLHDSQYTEEEYELRVGWGHSSVAHAVAFAQIVEASRLVLVHHDPHHADSDLDGLLARARRLWGDDGAGPVLGHEGMTFDLS